jgi:hypothetical protein
VHLGNCEPWCLSHYPKLGPDHPQKVPPHCCHLCTAWLSREVVDGCRNLVPSGTTGNSHRLLGVRCTGSRIWYVRTDRKSSLNKQHRPGFLLRGTDGFTSSPREVVLSIFIALRNPSTSAGFEPANPGPVASTASTRSWSIYEYFLEISKYCLS